AARKPAIYALMCCSRTAVPTTCRSSSPGTTRRRKVPIQWRNTPVRFAPSSSPCRARSMTNGSICNCSDTRCDRRPEDRMKNGFRVYDTDTHIDPGADVLERYVEPGFRKRLDDLAPYRVAIKSR